MNNYQFQYESPSSKDRFKGEGHKRTAESVWETLSQDNKINVIGIEGPLGSGKSTVVKLIEQKSEEDQGNEKYEFITFDVERYQHGATKKALIEMIFTAISTRLNSSSLDKARNAKQIALGNRVEYDVVVDSKLNGWVIAFAITFLLAVGVIQEGVVGLGHFINGSNRGEASWPQVISMILLLVPFIILALSFSPLHHCKYIRLPSISNLFRPTGTDRINESFDITREVGAYELELALRCFVEVLPNDVHFVLVIDNIDRVTDHKLREVWSDIDVFTTIASKKIQVLIPYSHEHVSKALSENPLKDNFAMSEGREFIAKRIPISFRVSPIVTEDWKAEFKRMVSESLPEMPYSQVELAAKIIAIWTSKRPNNVTPRYLKRLINLVVSAMLVKAEDINPINVFYYYLAIHESGVALDLITSDASSRSDSHVSEDVYPLVSASFSLINKELNFKSISRDIASIHFQAPYNIAESELLGKPMLSALESDDFEVFLDKQLIFGYSSILKEILDHNGTEKIIKIASSIATNTPFEIQKTWFNNNLSLLNLKIESDDNEIKNIPLYIDSWKEITDAGYQLSDIKLQRIFKEIDSSWRKLDAANLFALYKLSSLLKKTPKIRREFDAKTFINVLWPNRSSFPDWKVELLSIKEDMALKIINMAKPPEGEEYTNEKVSVLNHVLDKFMVGWETPSDKGTDKLLSYSEIESFPELAVHNVFFKEWNVAAYNQILSLVAKLPNGIAKELMLAQALVCIVKNDIYAKMDSLNTYREDRSLNEDYLANFLSVQCNSTQIVNALQQPTVKELISPAIKQLIINKRFAYLSPHEYAKNFNLLLELDLPESVLVNLVVTSSSTESEISFFLGADITFIESICNDGVNKVFKERFNSILGDQTEEWWFKQVLKPQENVKRFFEKRFLDKGANFLKCSNLVSAISSLFYRDSEKAYTRTDRSWIKTLFTALPRRSQTKLIKHLQKELNTYRSPEELQLAIIYNFGPEVKLIVNQDSETIEVSLHLLGLASADKDLSEWLAGQDFQLNKWPKNHINDLIDILRDEKNIIELIPGLKNNKQIMKKIENHQS